MPPRLIAKLSPKQIEAVSIEIAKLGSVPPDEQAKTIRDFMQANPKSLTARIGGLSLAQALVDRALGDKAKDTINSVRQSVEALPFGFLKKSTRRIFSPTSSMSTPRRSR
ncbi:MAG: hypothetical protein R3B96_13920 [Pirellulaceae bacterium]